MKIKLFTILTISIGLLSFIPLSKKKSYCPPGTVEIATNLFMDETEITNISWQEYMYWMEQNHGKTSEEYLAVLPDTNVWNEMYKSMYLTHPAYRDYPVVGVTWKQAKAYCEWRSDRVMELILINKAEKPNKVYPTKVTYRLPTLEEWEHIASAGYSEKTQKALNKKHADSSKGNFKSSDSNSVNVTAPVYQYWPNKYGIYNMLGNVAEMTSNEGVAKGGSWFQLEQDVTVEKNFELNQPENWVGFRCICEVEFSDI